MRERKLGVSLPIGYYQKECLYYVTCLALGLKRRTWIVILLRDTDLISKFFSLLITIIIVIIFIIITTFSIYSRRDLNNTSSQHWEKKTIQSPLHWHLQTRVYAGHFVLFGSRIIHFLGTLPVNNAPRSNEPIRLFETPRSLILIAFSQNGVYFFFFFLYQDQIKDRVLESRYARRLKTRSLGNIGKGDNTEFQQIDDKPFHHYVDDLS